MHKGGLEKWTTLTTVTSKLCATAATCCKFIGGNTIAFIAARSSTTGQSPTKSRGSMNSTPKCERCKHPIRDMPVLDWGHYYHEICWVILKGESWRNREDKETHKAPHDAAVPPKA